MALKCKGCLKPFEQLNELGLCPMCDAREKRTPHKSPSLAMLLSFIPGVGQLYLGETDRAKLLFCLSFLLFFAGLIIWPLLLLLPGGVLLSVISAWESANRINRNKTQLI